MPRNQPRRKKPIIGLTGGIGAGKSTVAGILESLGAAIIDSDRLAHATLQEADVVRTLQAWWGDVLSPDGKVDRKAVAEIVFHDDRELARLEKLLYPRIEKRRAELVVRHEQDPSVRAIVLDVPKLFEAGVHKVCDVVLFIEADEEVRVRRLAAARGWSPAELKRREKRLQSLDNKRVLADHVVVNNSGIDELRPAVERVLSTVLTSYSRSLH